MDSVTVERHAEMLANRVRKSSRKMKKAFEREGIGAYRLYDRDIPEVRAVVDRYEDHLVVGEYARTQTADAPNYVETLAAAAGAALGIDPSKLHLKRRQTRPKAGARYHRLAKLDEGVEVRERALRFWVNLDDYLDTGLFSDHRDTRQMVGRWSEGKSVLNLFGYTGTFTCWAAHGGATRTVTVDASGRYLAWAKDNLELNGLGSEKHERLEKDVASYLSRADETFDLVVVDPPSFSSSYGAKDFDVLRDHPALLASIAPRVAPGGRVLFSTNHQRFEPRFERLPFGSIEETTAETVPRDYRNRTAHRSFVLEG